MDRATAEHGAEKPASGSSVAVWIAVAATLIVLTLAWIFLPVKEWIALLPEWTRGLGAAGIVAFAVIYVVAVITLAPAFILTIAAGIAYGAWGFPLVVIAATIGATAAFLISRLIVRERVRAIARRHPVLQAIDQALAEEGWRVIALVRLSPLVPFNLQNYFFGATKVPLAPYVAATFFGIMPGTAMYIYLGTLGHAAATGTLSGPKIALLLAGLVASVAVVAIVGRKARAKLRQMGVSDEAGQAKDAQGIVLESVITCPHCGKSSRETMPSDSCQIRYACGNCGRVLQPRAGDCCVFCSYGSVPCPPIQAERLGKSAQPTCCS